MRATQERVKRMQRELTWAGTPTARMAVVCVPRLGV